MDFLEIEEKLNTLKVKKNSVKELIDMRTRRQEEIETEMEVLLKSLTLSQEVAKEVQSKLSVKIDGIVNLGLATCFGDEYTFKLEYVPARGKTEVRFNLYDKSGDVVDPMNQNGGGLLDLLTFCLRIAVYNITNVSNTIILDEPFKFVSKGLRDKTAELLHTLSERLDLQIIEVTHVEEMVEHSDKQFLVKKINGISSVVV